ncbi:formyl transferase [Haematococcus lacustris]
MPTNRSTGIFHPHISPTCVSGPWTTTSRATRIMLTRQGRMSLPGRYAAHPTSIYTSIRRRPAAGVRLRASTSAQPQAQLAHLLVSCPDAKGVVASLSQLLFGLGCNIISSDQYSDIENMMFFQRVAFDYSDLVIGHGNTPVLERAIGELARRFDMKWRIAYRTEKKRVAILVSRLDHCLYDLLIRHKSGELHCDIPIIMSNHTDLQSVAEMFNIPFRCLPLANKEDKAAQEASIEEVLTELKIDTIILARYMQVLSPEFCSKHHSHTINIHHSFLPAFEGARPYHRAHERGVKIIGATAHYATSELDAGPIIDQHTTRITHRDSVADMVRKGRDLERMVLARAVRWHCDDRVLVHGNKTVVFED